MSSPMSHDRLWQCILSVIESAKARGLTYPEPIEFQISVKMFDPQMYKRLCGPKSDAEVCILADQQHSDEACALNIPYRSELDIVNISENKKHLKKIVNMYLAFLVSDTIADDIPLSFFLALSRAGKQPQRFSHHDSMLGKIEEVRAELKREMERVVCVKLEPGDVSTPPAEIKEHIISSVNVFLKILKKDWRNVETLYIKSSKGQPYKVY